MQAVTALLIFVSQMPAQPMEELGEYLISERITESITNEAAGPSPAYKASQNHIKFKYTKLKTELRY